MWFLVIARILQDESGDLSLNWVCNIPLTLPIVFPASCLFPVLINHTCASPLVNPMSLYSSVFFVTCQIVFALLHVLIAQYLRLLGLHSVPWLPDFPDSLSGFVCLFWTDLQCMNAWLTVKTIILHGAVCHFLCLWPTRLQNEAFMKYVIIYLLYIYGLSKALHAHGSGCIWSKTQGHSKA